MFCGSNRGINTVNLEAARVVGTALVRRGIGLVYGGGKVGLMGALADAIAAGGEVIGVIPQALVSKEVAHKGLSDLRIVSSMHERKALMAELANGFIALPGGFGTVEDFCEVVTYGQLGLHNKPCGILNVAGFFDSLLVFVDHAVAERFIRAEHRSLILAETDVDRLLFWGAGGAIWKRGLAAGLCVSGKRLRAVVCSGVWRRLFSFLDRLAYN